MCNAIHVGEGYLLLDPPTFPADPKSGRHFHTIKYSHIERDFMISDSATIAPCVCNNENAVIEDEFCIGAGANLRPSYFSKPLRIGKGAIIGMVARVTKDVEPGAAVVGNPAQPLFRLAREANA